MCDRFESTIISFSDAETMKKASSTFDIGVMDSGSGEWFSFNDDQNWTYQGFNKTFKEVVSEIGLGGMDNQYVFVWLHIV